MKIEFEFLKYIKHQFRLDVVYECSNYGCIADILGVNKHKKEIYEFEFKRSSVDLKIAEKRKYKYQCEKKTRHQYHDKYKEHFFFAKEMPRPHKFFYVVPVELWEKEKDYLMQQKNAGVYIWQYVKEYDFSDVKILNFQNIKRAKKHESNLQKYEIVCENIMHRLCNIFIYKDLK